MAKKTLQPKHRPIQGLKYLINPNVKYLNKSEYRFVKLLKSIDAPLDEKKIIDFYVKNVKSNIGRFVFENGEWVEYQYSEQEIKIKSLQWFDYNLGKIIRKNILSKEGDDTMKLLTNIS